MGIALGSDLAEGGLQAGETAQRVAREGLLQVGELVGNRQTAQPAGRDCHDTIVVGCDDRFRLDAVDDLHLLRTQAWSHGPLVVQEGD